MSTQYSNLVGTNDLESKKQLLKLPKKNIFKIQWHQNKKST